MALKYALSPVVKTVPAILSRSFAVASALAPRSAAPQSAMSPAPTRTAIWGVGGGGGATMTIGSGPGPGGLARLSLQAAATDADISAQTASVRGRHKPVIGWTRIILQPSCRAEECQSVQPFG